MISGKWLVVSGQWLVVSGQWLVISGQWSVVSGQSLIVSCRSNPRPDKRFVSGHAFRHGKGRRPEKRLQALPVHDHRAAEAVQDLYLRP